MLELELLKLVSHVWKWLFDIEVDLTRKRDARRFLKNARELEAKGCVDKANTLFRLALRICPETYKFLSEAERKRLMPEFDDQQKGISQAVIPKEVSPLALHFFALDPQRKRQVHFFLCKHALDVWDDYARTHFPIIYRDSAVGMNHTVDEVLPQNAFASSHVGRDLSSVDARYTEPIVAMQDGDLEFPEHVQYAYYSIYNLFCKCVLQRHIDDWLIVNQALSSEENPAVSTDLFRDAMHQAMAEPH
jgi:hypothetical protein